MPLIHSELNTLQLYFHKYSTLIGREFWRQRYTANESDLTSFGGIISVDCCFIHAFPLLGGLQQEKGKEKLVCVLANGISIKTSRKRRTVPAPARHKRAGTFFRAKLDKQAGRAIIQLDKQAGRATANAL